MVEQEPVESAPQTGPMIDKIPSERSLKVIWTAGCFLSLLAWLVLMIIPPILFILAFWGNITISRFWGDVPDRHDYPAFQINLIMEDEFRGLSFVNTDLHSGRDLTLCVQTTVRYLLWEGEGENTEFCTCYSRDDDKSEWILTETSTTACSD